MHTDFRNFSRHLVVIVARIDWSRVHNSSGYQTKPLLWHRTDSSNIFVNAVLSRSVDLPLLNVRSRKPALKHRFGNEFLLIHTSVFHHY